MRICLDAGHTYGLNGEGRDPGAVNKELGIKESVIAMEMVHILKYMLKDDGHDLILTRSDGRSDLTLKKRCDIARKFDADLFISIHLNSCDNPSANGIETLRYNTRNSKTIKYADSVQRSLIWATEAKDRGVKIRNNLYVLKHTVMPAILVETGFISNKEEGLKLNDPAYQRLICRAIRRGILNAESF